MLMRVLGVVAIVVGLVVLYQAMMLDTTVQTESGLSINNLGLMAEQRNYMTMGGVVAIVGCALFAVGELASRKK